MIFALALSCYTNLAGQVIAATPQRIEGDRVVFAERTLPLRIFPAGEQQRLKAAVGIRDMPGLLKPLAAEIVSQLRRAEARMKAGRITAAKLAETRGDLEAGWGHAVDMADLSDEEKIYWKGHCPR